MIERLHRIATVLARFRGLLLTIVAVSVAAVVVGFFDNPWFTADSSTIPGLTAALWGLVLYSLSYLFLTAPESVQPQMTFRKRWSVKFRRAVMWLLALVFLALSASLLLLSYQLLRVFLS